MSEIVVKKGNIYNCPFCGAPTLKALEDMYLYERPPIEKIQGLNGTNVEIDENPSCGSCYCGITMDSIMKSEFWKEPTDDLGLGL